MSEHSPRRSPRKAMSVPQTPPQWMKPDDVMKQRRLRIKQNALENRINRGESPKQTSPIIKKSPMKAKRKNPFSRRIELANSPVKKKVKQEMGDESLFQLLGLAKQETQTFDLSACVKEEELPFQGSSYKNIPVDWTLRTKLRFTSKKQFPWTQTLKTCEESAGVTGFARCVGSGGGGWEGLDTSPNALFHQCCLYWQHPHLPWLQLFPRNLRRNNKNVPPLTAYPEVKDSLHRDWSESFRSLFQLVRTRHCPFFYIVSYDFNGVFRAAGINGSTETNAILNPTTRGLRNLLTKEGISFTMPLKSKTKRISEDFNEDEPEGDDDEQEIDNTKWLVSLGIDEEAFTDLNKSQNKLAEMLDKSEGQNESLVYIEGTELQSLFNFLINCRTISALTGPLSGVPPSLISPVAFTGGTLNSLKVRQNTVKVDNENYHSMEVMGPILPQTMMNLCNLLENNRDSFSVTSANIDSTKAFTAAINTNDLVKADGSPAKVGKSGQAFSIESLKDCGFQERVLNSFCSEVVETFDSVKYSNNLYKCF